MRWDIVIPDRQIKYAFERPTRHWSGGSYSRNIVQNLFGITIKGRYNLNFKHGKKKRANNNTSIISNPFTWLNAFSLVDEEDNGTLFSGRVGAVCAGKL